MSSGIESTASEDAFAVESFDTVNNLVNTEQPRRSRRRRRRHRRGDPYENLAGNVNQIIDLEGEERFNFER